MVESISLTTLDNNHEQIGDELSVSVQRWLDAEWMPQEIHVRMGASCKATYVTCRQDGVDDLMSIMTAVADDLEQDWFALYDAEAFVGPWDVVNYVSGFLTAQTGIEGCECSAKLY